MISAFYKHSLRSFLLYSTIRCSTREIQTNAKFLKVSEEVQEAVHAKKPIVALETTIYTHGWPYPDNLKLASHLESIVRVNGGVPATIGILHGRAMVGFTQAELGLLLEEPGAQKISRRDLAFATGLRTLGAKINGGTTIAGTMVLAHLAGIKVFATGGLGGVHRGGESSLDISADLTELGRTPVAVISSGCKSFLDIPRTLEYLETEGVGVATFADGRTGNIDFPAFWSRDSGVKTPKVVQNEMEAAYIIYAQNMFPLSSGLHFANPVPEESSIPFSEVQGYIKEAVRLADEAGITGADNTPFILRTIKELSKGRSVEANRALVESNVTRGTKVAVELAKIEQSRASRQTFSIATQQPVKQENVTQNIPSASAGNIQPVLTTNVDVIVAGGLAMDTSCNYTPLLATSTSIEPQRHTSNPASISQSLGGVARNIAKTMHLLGSSVKLCSLVGDDASGKAAIQLLECEGQLTEAVLTLDKDTNLKTAQYISVNDREKNLFIAMADMSIFESPNSSEFDRLWAAHICDSKAKWFVLDANWHPSGLQKWLSAAKASKASVAFEPVSIEKSARIFALPFGKSLTVFPRHAIDLATPNALELTAMHAAARDAEFLDRDEWWTVIDALGISAAGARSELEQATSSALVDEGIPQRTIQLLPFIPCLLTKLGPQGVLLTRLLHASDPALSSPDAAPYILSRSKTEDAGVGGIYMRHFPAPEVLQAEDIVSVNGAGDTFLGAIISGLAHRSILRVDEIIDAAQSASAMTLMSGEAVHPELGRLSPLFAQI